MKNIIKIFLADMRRLSRNVVAVVVIMGLCIIPSLYAWFNIFSNWDPYGPDSTSNLKVAVVSLDAGCKVASIDLNVGDSVISGLKSNNTIGWVFTDTDKEAVEGVDNGDYYAALVIPEDFSEDMISFLGGDVEHPEITYYENDKKNAIAPKITGKAKTAVQEQVNSTFVSTLAQSLMEVSNIIGQQGTDNNVLSSATDKLTQLRDNLKLCSGLLGSFTGITDSASELMSAGQAVLPNLEDMINNGKDTLNSIQGAAIDNSGNAQAVLDMIKYSFKVVDGALDDFENQLDTAIDSVTDRIDDMDKMDSLKEVLPYIRKLYDNAVSGLTGDEIKAQAEVVDKCFDAIEDDLKNIGNDKETVDAGITALYNDIKAQIQSCRDALSAAGNSLESSVIPDIRQTMTSVQKSMLDVQTMLGGVNGDFSDVSSVMDEYQDILKDGTAGVTESKTQVDNVIAGLDSVIETLDKIADSDEYGEMLDMLMTDPAKLASFIASPIQVDTREIYPIANYGSAMAPFYTILALWVGALILVAIVHVKVLPESGITNVKPYQQYFGRYIFFFLMGQAQTLITVLGEIFYIKIQCPHPFLYWLAAAISSLVFTLFIYSLTVAFGNVGEALAVIVMVIQVAGAGGTFPIETLPQVYRNIYKYLPFPYGMNAMRECIGGMYGHNYIRYLAVMGIYVIISLIIGLALAVPFRKMNEKIEHSKQKSDVMI